MRQLGDIPVSVLDLSPITRDGDASEALRNSLDLARHAEHLGFHRYWLAEHHNMPGIASAATAVVIGHVAGGTTSIRVGSGGIMLPNHAPLVIAEQFGTLEALYPGRIDLGLGRAPGTDPLTIRALRRELKSDGLEFPQQLAELQHFLAAPEADQKVVAVPGAASRIPIWLLSSSGYSADLAASLGLPFCYAAHFSPEALLPSLAMYRRYFTPSPTLAAPYAMVAINVIAADTDEAAKRLATTHQQAILHLIRGRPQKVSPPVDDIEALMQPHERSVILQRSAGSIVGSAETVREKLEEFLASTEADELMVHTIMYDHAARKRSYEIVAEIVGIGAARPR